MEQLNYTKMSSVSALSQLQDGKSRESSILKEAP